jgi:hypothetical protein
MRSLRTRRALAGASLALLATVPAVVVSTPLHPRLAWPDPRGPYYPLPADFGGARDAVGMRIYVQENGAAYQHPVAQATDGLWSLANYYDSHNLAECDGSALLQTSRPTFTSPCKRAINTDMTIAGVTVWRIANATDAASVGGS